MNEVNELIKNLEIRELTIEQFLKELELNPIKIKQKENSEAETSEFIFWSIGN